MNNRDLILKVLETNDHQWVPGHQLQKAQTPWGFIGTSGDVRCRELEREGLIEKKKIGPYTHFRVKPRQLPLRYSPGLTRAIPVDPRER